MSWELRLGDCLDPVTGLASLADRSVDHVICDPPYEAEAHTKGRRGRGGGGVCVERPLGFEAITEEVREAVGAQVERIARRWVIVFCQVEAAMKWREALEGSGLEYVRTAVWIKPDAAPQFTGDRPGMGYESMVVCHHPGKKRWNGGGRRGVFEHAARTSGACVQAERSHPTQKPDALMDELVRLFTDKGESIVDPFAGSGSTGVAAVRMGREFLGWEVDPKFHRGAMKRLTAAREQLSMFDGAA